MRWLVIVVLSSLPAQAQPVDPGLQGRLQFEHGSAEFNLGHYEKALLHFEASYRFTNKPALLFNIGVVEKALYDRTRQVEHLERAIERWRALIDSTTQDTDPKMLALRSRVESQLKAAEDELRRVKSERAKGDAVLELGEELLSQGKLEEAAAQLEKFEKTPGNERPGIARALKLRGGIAIARGDEAAAIQAYAGALSLDKSLSPPVVEAAQKAFGAAQAQVGPQPPLSVSHTPEGSLKPGAAVVLVFATQSDPAHLIEGVQVRYRSGSGAWSALPPRTVGRISLPPMFSAALHPGQKVEYYGEVVDKTGAVLQHLGTADLPFSVVVETPRSINVAKKWWFWTVTGVVVAGVALGAGLGVYYSQPSPPLSVPVHTGLHSW